MATAVDRVQCPNSGYHLSWIGFILITTYIGMSTESVIGLNCTDVCTSLRMGDGTNWSYLTLNPTDNSWATLSLCGTTANLTTPNDTEEIDIGRLCSDVYANMSVRVVSSPLINVSALPISVCMRACAICKVDFQRQEKEEARSNMSLEKVTNCTRKGLGLFQSEAERNETLRDIEMSYTNYSMVIARVVPGVLIANGSKETCLYTYAKWLCRTRLPILVLRKQGEELSALKPCLEVCWEVLVECPFFLPAQLQYSAKQNEFLEEQYAGTPVFDCPRVDSVSDNPNSRYRVCAPSPTNIMDYNRTCL